MRRLVYLANAIPELFICLLPGSASRECLYIRANTPRVLYTRGSRVVQGLPGCVAVGRAHERSVLSFLSYATSVSRSLSRLSPSLRSLSSSLFSSPLFPYLYSPLSISFAEATVQFRVKENENISEKKMIQEKRKAAVRTRYLRGISHEVDPVLNIDEFALDGISSGTKNKH